MLSAAKQWLVVELHYTKGKGAETVENLNKNTS